MRQNWSETGFGFEFKPDREQYEQTEKVGRLAALAAYCGDRMVGYVVLVFSRHDLNPDVTVASAGTVFVLPEFRKGTAAGRLLVAAEDMARANGARFVSWHPRTASGFHEALLRRGYADVNTICIKEF